MKKQKIVKFTGLVDLLNCLDKDSNKYKIRMLDFDKNTVFIGGIYIRRFQSIDIEDNYPEQYLVLAGANEYRIFRDKIFTRKKSDNGFMRMDFSEQETEHMWYQIACIHQYAIDKNLQKFFNSQTKRDLVLILLASILASVTACIMRDIQYTKQDKAKNAKEITNEKTQMNPVDTIVYNASQYTK